MCTRSSCHLRVFTRDFGNQKTVYPSSGITKFIKNNNIASMSSSQGFPSSPGPRRTNGAAVGNLGGLPSSSADQSILSESDAPPRGARARPANGGHQNGDDRDDDARQNRADEAAEEGAGRGGNRGPRARNLRNIDDIPAVSDQTGEKVRESFEHFLER